MHIEYEVRILNVNKEEIKKKLEKLNAEFKWERIQKRYTYDFNPVLSHKWIRLRTDGEQTTLAIKNVNTKEIDGTEELEISVSDFENTNLILKELGYLPKAFQENKRCRYYLHNVEIDIDSWPMIPDYIEIEGQNEEEVYEIVKLLGYTKEDVTAKDVASIYKEYGYELEELNEIKLEGDRK